MESNLMADVAMIQSMKTIPTILDAVASITGLRFVCVSRVTSDKWVTCAVLDQLNFGLAPGAELDISTTFCEKVCGTGNAIIINNVSEDPVFRDHPIPKMYGFESYISIPIVQKNGEFFGTLCGLDLAPLDLNNTATVSSMEMFAELISHQLASEKSLAETQRALKHERETAEFREQFIAVLGHDIRNPLNAILTATQMLKTKKEIEPKVASMIQLIHNSADRISGIVNDVVDLTRGKMGGGIAVQLSYENDLSETFNHVISELLIDYPSRAIVADVEANVDLYCDRGRLGQLLSNLVKNALIHGDTSTPINVVTKTSDGLFHLSVTNGGPTLSQDTIKNLFKAFWRASNSLSTEGLGLGLFIVSEIARSHNGTINVYSANGSTTFTLTIKNRNFIERRNNVLSAPAATDRRTVRVLQVN